MGATGTAQGEVGQRIEVFEQVEHHALVVVGTFGSEIRVAPHDAVHHRQMRGEPVGKERRAVGCRAQHHAVAHGGGQRGGGKPRVGALGRGVHGGGDRRNGTRRGDEGVFFGHSGGHEGHTGQGAACAGGCGGFAARCIEMGANGGAIRREEGVFHEVSILRE